MVDDWTPVPVRSWLMVGMVDDQSGNKFGKVNKQLHSFECRKNRTGICQYTPMDIHMLLYIYIICVCNYLCIYICTYLSIPALCNRRYEFVFFQSSKSMDFFPFRSHQFWVLRIPGIWRMRGEPPHMSSTGGWDMLSWSLCEQWKNPGCLGYIGDFTTQFFRDYNEPL